MRKHHVIKIHTEHYQKVLRGSKTFEIRKNDRGYEPHDFVTLRPWNPETKDYIYPEESVNNLEFVIGDVYPIDADRVVFSLLPIKEQGK